MAFKAFHRDSPLRSCCCRRLKHCECFPPSPCPRSPLPPLPLYAPAQVVDHQRLSAAGYCYSASAPPFVSAAASEALRMLRSEPGLVSALRKNAEFLHKAVSEISGLKVHPLSWQHRAGARLGFLILLLFIYFFPSFVYIYIYIYI